MPPTRPVAGATIATDWGQQAHDFVFAPAGCQAHSSGTRSMGAGNPSTLLKLHLDTVDEDPGGYVDTGNDQITIPANGGGLYTFNAVFRTDDGASGDETNVRLRLNGSDIAFAQVGNEGATAIFGALPWVGVLSAGDDLEVYARQIGAGARAVVELVDVVLIRVGAEFGAP